MEDLRALFHAEGDGLEVAEVQQMSVGVHDLLIVLQLETEILVDNLKQVSSFSIKHFQLRSSSGPGLQSFFFFPSTS